jgi:hypothetical protein
MPNVRMFPAEPIAPYAVSHWPFRWHQPLTTLESILCRAA